MLLELLPLPDVRFRERRALHDTISCKVMQSFYREILLDHFEHPRNRRELEDADIPNISIIPSVATW